MTDHAGHIRNPLTVISIFAGIAEISGTVVLPFIAPENQGTYIWFLMLFPALLVVAFFLTLNLNHKTLYAPSDYQNQNHFLSLFGIATSDEKETKLNEEVMETSVSTGDTQPTAAGNMHAPQPKADTAEPQNQVLEPVPAYDVSPPVLVKDDIPEIETVDEDNSDTATNSFNFTEFAKKSEIELKQKLKVIEKRSIQKLKEATNVSFSESVKFDIPNLIHPLIFDAVAHQNETIHIAEVKYFEKQRFVAERFNATLNNANLVAQSVYSVSNRKVVVHLVVVVNYEMTPVRYQTIQNVLLNAAKKYPFQTKVYVITEHGLTQGGVPGSWIKSD